MNHLIGCLLIFMIILFLKAIRNQCKFKRIEALSVEYLSYVSSHGEKAFEFHQNAKEIIDLFKDADVEDITEVEMRHVGYAKLMPYEVSSFDNLATLNGEIIKRVALFFAQAQGAFKRRRNEAFSPIYWIEVCILLPKKLIEFLGFNKSSKNVRMFINFSLFTYWIIAALLGLYHSNIVGNYFLVGSFNTLSKLQAMAVKLRM